MICVYVWSNILHDHISSSSFAPFHENQLYINVLAENVIAKKGWAIVVFFPFHFCYSLSIFFVPYANNIHLIYPISPQNNYVNMLHNQVQYISTYKQVILFHIFYTREKIVYYPNNVCNQLTLAIYEMINLLTVGESIASTLDTFFAVFVCLSLAYFYSLSPLPYAISWYSIIAANNDYGENLSKGIKYFILIK